MHVPRGHLRGSQSSERWPWPIGPPEGVPSEAVGARLPSSCSFDLTLRAPSRGALQGRGPGRPSPAPPPPPPSPTLDMDRQVGHTALSRLHLGLLWSLRECGKPSLPCWWPWSPEGGFSLQSGWGWVGRVSYWLTAYQGALPGTPCGMAAPAYSRLSEGIVLLEFFMMIHVAVCLNNEVNLMLRNQRCSGTHRTL